MNYQYYEKKV